MQYFYTRLFVPQASQNSPERRAKSDILPAIPSTQSVCGMEITMRIMGLDYGDKTVGVAISDEMLLTAQPKETIQRERPAKLRQTLARIEALIREYDVEKIVIGQIYLQKARLSWKAIARAIPTM